MIVEHAGLAAGNALVKFLEVNLKVARKWKKSKKKVMKKWKSKKKVTMKLKSKKKVMKK